MRLSVPSEEALRSPVLAGDLMETAGIEPAKGSRREPAVPLSLEECEAGWKGARMQADRLRVERDEARAEVERLRRRLQAGSRRVLWRPSFDQVAVIVAVALVMIVAPLALALVLYVGFQQ